MAGALAASGATSSFTAAVCGGNLTRGRSGGGSSAWFASTNRGAGPRVGMYAGSVTGAPPMKSGQPYQAPRRTSNSRSGRCRSAGCLDRGAPG